MTTKQYRTAMGKTVDMGALMLQHEQVRAVGNMSINARGDKLDSTNRVIDQKSRQVNRQYKKQSAGENIPVSTSNAALKRTQEVKEMPVDPTDTFEDLVEEDTPESTNVLQGGLAAAIAKAKTVQQTKLPTLRESAKAAGVRKL